MTLLLEICYESFKGEIRSSVQEGLVAVRRGGPAPERGEGMQVEKGGVAGEAGEGESGAAASEGIGLER